MTTVRTVDFGATTLTVVLPRVNLIGSHHHVDTLGILTLHPTSIAGIGHGQLSTNHTVRLRGTASQIES